ncbi:MAG: Iron-sulfur cluster insertion protein ErpA [Candidatus Heimdallarchaeota archaeon LC_2]|nr:MAG: Iron-sulfur cluster insertion protein ErpA [Candidatus Heimdallarchaeota archaeon LC_2]
MSQEQTSVNLKSDTPFVTVSETALKAVRDVIQQQDKEELFLRLFVQSSASGVGFGMALDTRRSDDDHTCFYEGIEVVIDRISFPYLDGANVDFVEGEEKSGFQVTSPNEHLMNNASGCGSCGGDAGCC